MISLSRAEVARLLSMEECIEAVDGAFRLYGEGRTGAPGILGMHAPGGGFHIKAAFLPGKRTYFAAKVNGNFSQNPDRFGLPAIQGAIFLADGSNGEPLAVMDSIEITILRTAAATAVAARRLARADSAVATVCGCGNQGRAHLQALSRVLSIRTWQVWDADPARAQALAREPAVVAVADLAAAVAKSDVVVTCTPARLPFLRRGWIRPGTFLAAVGADAPDKQELEPDVLEAGKLVVDVLDQCQAIGELHHAPGAKVHAELGQILAGTKPGRESAEEICVFDSTGTALQDVAAAALVYEKSLRGRAASGGGYA